MSAPGRFDRLDVTPFIDVLLVLLILFMVVAPMREQALRGELPAAGGGAERPPLRVIVSAGGLSLDGVPFGSVRELGAALRERTQGEASVVLVAAEDGVDYARVVAAIDAAQGAGADRIGLIESAPDESEDPAAAGGTPRP